MALETDSPGLDHVDGVADGNSEFSGGDVVPGKVQKVATERAIGSNSLVLLAELVGINSVWIEVSLVSHRGGCTLGFIVCWIGNRL